MEKDRDITTGLAPGLAPHLAKICIVATAEPLVAQADHDLFLSGPINGLTGPASASLDFPATFLPGNEKHACTTSWDRFGLPWPIQSAKVPFPFDQYPPPTAIEAPSLAKAWPPVLNLGTPISAGVGLTDHPPNLPSKLPSNLSTAWPIWLGFDPTGHKAALAAVTVSKFDKPLSQPTGPLAPASPPRPPWLAKLTRLVLNPGDRALFVSRWPWAEAQDLRPRDDIPAISPFFPPSANIGFLTEPLSCRAVLPSSANIGFLTEPLSRRAVLPSMSLWRSRDSPRHDPRLKAHSVVPRLAHDVRLGILDWVLGPSP
ncbi:MAG: hypothetical protein LBJ61_04835 [Deltaproteobacteria bacterium]|nr:hypothetical protein [Deltaproteobacteria bacterium]